MYLSITPDDLADAPAAVQTWLSSKFFPDKKATPAKRKKATETTEAPVEPPPHSDVLERAGKYVEAKGEPELIAIFESMGIKKLSDCKPEQRAELLARMAVA